MYPVTPRPGDQPETVISVLLRACGGTVGVVGRGTAPAGTTCTRSTTKDSTRRAATRRRRNKAPAKLFSLISPSTYTRSDGGVQWRTPGSCEVVPARIAPPCPQTLTVVHPTPAPGLGPHPARSAWPGGRGPGGPARTPLWPGRGGPLTPTHRRRRDPRPTPRSRLGLDQLLSDTSPGSGHRIDQTLAGRHRDSGSGHG